MTAGRDHRDDGSPARGCLVAVALVLVVVLAGLAAVLWVKRGTGLGPTPPGPSSVPTLSPAISTAAVSPYDPAIEVEWGARRFGCGTPSQWVTDEIAPVLVELGVPKLDAVIAVGLWRDRVACPGR